MRYLAFCVICLLFTGCASVDYQRYADANVAMQVAKANAEAERYRALAAIANSGDSTAKVAAVMAMMTLNGQQQTATIAAPKSGWDTAREFAQVIVPAAAAAFGFYAAMETNIVASNNSRDVARSTNEAFVGVAGKIQAPPAPVTPQANVTTTTTTTNTDNSVRTYSTTDNHAVATTSTSTTDNHATTTDNHATNPTQVITVPTKVCAPDANGTMVCQ